MILASNLKGGVVIQKGEELFRVIEATYHMGGGKTGGMVHAKLKNLKTAHPTEQRYSPDEKLEELTLERRNIEYLYSAGDELTFMDSQTFDQFSMGRGAVATVARYLKEGMKLQADFHEGVLVELVFPKEVEAKIAETGSGISGQDTTYKEAVLENGVKVMVPQFIQTGDLVRVEVETSKYVERVRNEQKSAGPNAKH